MNIEYTSPHQPRPKLKYKEWQRPHGLNASNSCFCLQRCGNAFNPPLAATFPPPTGTEESKAWHFHTKQLHHGHPLSTTYRLHRNQLKGHRESNKTATKAAASLKKYQGHRLDYLFSPHPTPSTVPAHLLATTPGRIATGREEGSFYYVIVA